MKRVKEGFMEKGNNAFKRQDTKARSYLMQRISMTMQKGSAACIVSARPSDEELDSIFYL